jgi:GntR family transcriptional regulator / MocR family aminotransferase
MESARQKISVTVAPIITVDRKARRPLHRQIYDAYCDAIVKGNLRPGQRVPSTRSLSSELGVSRIPVLSAYAQLIAEGYFQSRTGAGTTISLSLPEHNLLPARGGERSVTGPSRHVRALGQSPQSPESFENPLWRRGWGPFGVGQVASDEFPFRIWNSLVARQCRATGLKSLDYGHPMGLKELREALAVYLRTARGVRCESDQIMIVSGSQQALDIAVRVLLKPGSHVWMEEPGYRYARRVFSLNGCHAVPVPVDDQGLNVALGVKQCRKARAVLVTPSHQYPLGATMSASRRLQLLDWATRSGSWILEDDYDSDYRYESSPISSLQGLDSNSRVVYIGTFSKVLFPSLRLGYLVIPRDLIARFLAVRVAMDIGPATLCQAVLADFIQEGHFSRHIRRMRLLYRERRNVLVRSIEKEFGATGEVTGEQAGMHLCLVLNGISDREIAGRAAHENLWLAPLSSSYMGKNARQGFILGFGSTAVSETAHAVQKLWKISGA